MEISNEVLNIDLIEGLQRHQKSNTERGFSKKLLMGEINFNSSRSVYLEMRTGLNFDVGSYV